MPSLMTPRAVQVTPLQLVFMNHEAPPSIAIDIQSWVRFGSGQLAISLERWTMPTLPAISRKLEMGGQWSVISAVVVACITSAPAQAQSVNRTASGQPNTDIRVGVYVNVRPDSTSGYRRPIQAMLGARSAGVRCVLPLARRFCGRRCFDLGSEVSGRQDASAADQCYGRNRIARAAHLNGRIKWSWCPRVDKPIARNHARRIRRRDRPRIAFWNPSFF